MPLRGKRIYMRRKTRPKFILLKKRPIHRNRNRKLRLVNSHENEYTRRNTGTRLIRKIFNSLYFISIIVGIIYFANSDYSPWFTTGVTEEEAMKITDDVVKTQTQLILQDLGIGDDGVSSRITIHNTYPDNDYAGLFHGESVITNGVQSYVQKSGVIDIYPMVYIKKRDKDGTVASFPVNQRFSKEEFRKEITKTLAHELRHYWQYQTGVFFKHPYDTNVPHDERWSEIDANDYEKKYYKSI